MALGKDALELADKLSYSFSDTLYLDVALTHSSYTNELRSKGMKADSNERLEFLGDAVLQLVISEHLYSSFSKYREGALTKMRQQLVCEKTLSRIARKIDLGQYINLGNGEEASDCRSRPKILADALEALIAAVYLDDRTNAHGNLYRAVVICLFEKEIENILKSGNKDYKTLLQQFVEKNGDALLRYDIEESGPEHQKTFIATAYINNNKVGDGKGSTKRAAEMQAAKVALRLFGII